MYVEASNIDRSTLFQGDIIREFPFPFFQEPIEVLAKQDNGTFKAADQTAIDLFKEGSDEVIKAYAKKTFAMIVSQSCDIQNRERVSVCRVLPISVVAAKHLENLKKRRIYYWFYLPKLEGYLEEGIADFQSIVSLPQSIVLSHLQSKQASLSDWGRHHLSWALQNYFGRPIEGNLSSVGTQIPPISVPNTSTTSAK